MAVKPTVDPKWSTANSPADNIEPTPSLKNGGVPAGGVWGREFLNWQFYAISQWIDWVRSSALDKDNNLSDLTNAATARTNLGLNNASVTLGANTTGSAAKWTTARTITLGGDLSGSVSIDGSANVTLSAQVSNDSHTHSASTITAATTSVAGVTRLNDTVTSNLTTQAATANAARLAYNRAAEYAPSKTGTGASGTWGISITGNAATATKLATARTIGGVSFDGTANINLPGVNIAGNQNTSGNAATATKLATARNLTIGNTGKSFDGSGNVSWTLDEIGALPVSSRGRITTQVQLDSAIEHGIYRVIGLSINGLYDYGILDVKRSDSTCSQTYYAHHALSSGESVCTRQTWGVTATPITWSGWRNVDGTAPAATKLATARTIGGVSFDGTANINLPGVNIAGNQNTSGNAATATKLATARTINGTSFDGSANITTANWGTPRTITIGNTGKSVNGSANVSWSLAEIGATNANGDYIVRDTRNVDTPTNLGAAGVKYEFKFNTTDGLHDGGIYHAVMTFQKWGDPSGGNTHQLGFTDNGNLWLRTAPIGGTWYTWHKVYHSGNLGAASETASGIVELATTAEVQAGTDNTRAVTPAGLASRTATEVRAGIVELATTAEAQALASAVVALTPARLADAFKGANQSLVDNGYQKLPGGLILQWGTVAGSEDVWGIRNFNIAFPNAALTIVASGSAGFFATDTDIQARVISATQFQVQNNAYGSRTINWIAIGY